MEDESQIENQDVISTEESKSSDKDSIEWQENSSEQTSLWRRHPGWLLFGIGFLIYMIVIPSVSMIVDSFTPAKSYELSDTSILDVIRLQTVSGIVTLLFLAIGASVGSFLNVVIFRRPRRRPLFWPPSACANCGTRLHGKDNIPIIGWMKLGGKCRYCDAPISVRYPLIEALMAGLFVTFFFRELLSGGLNLPVRTVNSYTGVVWILLYTKWDLVTLYLFHMFILVLLLTWSTINYDRFRVPSVDALVSVCLVMVLASIFPHLNPTHENWIREFSWIPKSVAASIVGVIVGYLIGWIFSRIIDPSEERKFGSVKTDEINDNRLNQKLVPEIPGDGSENRLVDLYGTESSNPISRTDSEACFGVVGAAFGVEGVIIIFGITLILMGIASLIGKGVFKEKRQTRSLPGTSSIFAGTFLFLFFWSSIHNQIRWILEFFA